MAVKTDLSSGLSNLEMYKLDLPSSFRETLNDLDLLTIMKMVMKKKKKIV